MRYENRNMRLCGTDAFNAKMKNIFVLPCCLVVLLAGAAPNTPSSPTNGPTSPINMPEKKEFESLCSVASELAIKQFDEDAKNGKINILTFHDNDFDFAKFTDGKYVVVSIPAVPEDASGFCRFLCYYNECNLQKADSLVVAGHYKEAKEFYEIMLHFEPCGLQSPVLRERLLYLDKLERNEDVTTSLEKFKQPCGCGSLVRWSRLQDLSAKTVTNLLTIGVGPIDNGKK
jgi:hypothetical protein